MEAKIESVEFSKEFKNDYGTFYSFKVRYNGKTGFYSSKSKDQKKFIAGQEAEFTEEERTSQHGPYTIIKPIRQQGQSNFSRKVKQEQARYSGFSMAYAKDLVVAGAIPYDKMFMEAELMFDWMVAKDKELQS